VQGRLIAVRRWRDAIFGWARRRPLVVDAVLAGALGLWFVVEDVLHTEDGLVRFGIVAGLTAPLVLRRRAPLAAFAAISLVAFLQWLLVDGEFTADLALIVAFYAVAAHEPRRWGVAAAAAILELGVLLAALKYTDDSTLASFVALSAFVVAAGALGVYMRTRRQHIAALHERAHQLERERDQQARLATAAERARIAREMHDVVAHNLSVMIALADGARLTAAQDPGKAEIAMGAVSSTGREALEEMRRLLGVLREDERADTPLGPQPGVDALDGLLEQVRGAGLATRLTCTGTPAPLSPGAQLAVYRLVQEALTNTLKHGRGASSAEVRLHYGADALALEVIDDGASAARPARNGGHGLAGMRERAAAYGGAVEAGPYRHGGWLVRARIPLVAEGPGR
jgi:signal transduction histidine kinase